MMRRTKDVIVSFEPVSDEDIKKVSLFWRVIYEWSDSLLIAILAIFILFAFVFRIATVKGDSMNPTLSDSDWVTVKPFTTEIKRGDIIISSQPNAFDDELLIKRVIAVAGDEVDINYADGIVYVNGDIVHEPYIAEPTKTIYDVAFPVTVPEGCYFVMGDNRNHSVDSRRKAVGFIKKEFVLGKVNSRIFPLGNFRVE